ncbi:MAG TPA: hypothetical protein VH276_17015 [Solirubrobacteraceae bacterium]|nr:hypothetical protein [Solirubrobacteraceae bacterium]
MWTARIATLVLALAATVPPAGADAAPGRSAGRLAGPPLGDGSRWIGWRGGGGVHVLDATTDETTTFASPAGCDFTALGGGQALFTCAAAAPGRSATPVLLSLTDGILHLPAGAELLTAPADAGVQDVYAVGRQGLAGGGQGFKGGYRFFFDWHRGAYAYGPTDREVIDLDHDPIVRPLCAPLGHKRADRTVYAPPYLVKGRYHRILIARCGVHAQRQIRCVGFCGTPSVGAGILTWTDARGVHARTLRGGRSWRFPGYRIRAQAGRTLLLARRLPGPGRLVHLR